VEYVSAVLDNGYSVLNNSMISRILSFSFTAVPVL
jgi:hypothetical protein